MKPPPDGFLTYDFSAPFDTDEVLRTLRPATAKGFVMQGMLREAQAQGKPLPDAPSYIMFKDYPFRETVTLSFRLIQHLYPTLPPREGLRRLGQRVYGSVLESTLGRAMFGLPGLRTETIMKLTPKAYGVFQKGGEVKLVTSTSDSAWFSYRNFPLKIDSYQIGMYEGGFLSRNIKHQIYLKTIAFGEADIFCTWDD